MSKDYFDIIEKVREKWEYPYAIFLLEGLILVISLAIWGKLNNNYILAIIPILMLVALVCWLYNNRIEKPKDGKIGIYVAISSENDIEKLRIKKDFLNGLEKEVANLNVFQIIPANQHKTEKLKNLVKSNAKLINFLNKTDISYVIWGDCRCRKENGQIYYYIELSSAIKHPVLTTEAQSLMGKDLKDSFQFEHLINVENEISGFKVTSANIAFSIKFIIGIACFLFKEPEKAFEIHSNLEENITTRGTKKEVNESKNKLEYIKKRLPSLLTEEALVIAKNTYYKLPTDYPKMKGYIDKIFHYNPNHYSTILLNAIYIFKFEKNIQLAITELHKVKNTQDAVLFYNLAFLYSYAENLDEAYKNYNKAFRLGAESCVMLETEIFITNELDIDPTKFQLYYNLGLINLKGKKDYILAQEHFRSFIIKAQEKSKFTSYIKHAEKYLDEANKKIKKGL